MAKNCNLKDPSDAPLPERWYNLTIGSSFKDLSSSSSSNSASSTKFFTLRYEFKPASIDKNQAGSLHKSKENWVTVEFQNNQLGKPKVTFEGNCEDYKDNDAVLFFDGKNIRLERLHRAVKRLRHVRPHGESSIATVAPLSTSFESAKGSHSPMVQKTAKVQPTPKTPVPPLPLEVERIDIGDPASPGPKPAGGTTCYLTSPPNAITDTPEQKNDDLEINIEIDDDEGSPNKLNAVVQESNTGFDINLPSQHDTDDEIADVDVSDDETDKGPNAAEALRAQVNAEDSEGQSTSSSGSSGSGGSGSDSGSGSSSSDSEGSDDDSASSGGDVDI